MKTFQTLEVLPAPSGRRFTVISIGMTQCELLREEFSCLREVAADVCGVASDKLTPAHLLQHQARLSAALAKYQHLSPPDVGSAEIVSDVCGVALQVFLQAGPTTRMAAAVDLCILTIAGARYLDERHSR